MAPRKKKEVGKKQRLKTDVDARQKALADVKLSNEQAETLDKLNKHICYNVPQAVHKNGAADIEAGDPNFAGKVDVPDARYRVDGSDMILTVKGRRLVTIEKAQPTADPKTYIKVPSN